jgi:hypothetical protein
MKLKWLFEGGIPGETYGEGVRRRSKGMLLTVVMVLLSAAIVAGIYSLSGSIWLSMVAAALCGIASMKVRTPFDLPVTESSRPSDKVAWLVLFTPALVLLAGAAIYEAVTVHSVFQAAGLAGLFGAALGATLMVLFDADSRTRA